MLRPWGSISRLIEAVSPFSDEGDADRPSVGQAREPDDAPRGAIALATAPPRLAGELLLALPYVISQIPPLVQDVRLLVGELTRLARGTDTGGLNDLLAELSRLAAEDGELTALLRESAGLAHARAEEARSGAASAGSGRSSGSGGA